MTNNQIIRAPQINPLQLWQMSAEDFNSWRKENDYPRIIGVLKNKLPDFESWMEDQKVSNELLINYSPSTFLKEENIFIYTVLHDGTEEKEILSSNKYKINQTFFHKNLKRLGDSLVLVDQHSSSIN